MNRKLYIGCPLHNGTCDAFRMGYGNLIQTGIPGWDSRWVELNGGGITVARNLMAAQAIRTQADVLLFVSGDIGFQNDQMAATVKRVLSHFERDPEIDIVGGIYLFKRYPLQMVLAQDEPRSPNEHGLIEVNRLGTDFVAVSIRSLEQIIEKWKTISDTLYGSVIPLKFESEYGPQWNIFGQSVILGGKFLTEDFYWCRLAREAGQKIYVDTQIRLQHWGQHNYDANQADGIDRALTVPNPEKEPDGK